MVDLALYFNEHSLPPKIVTTGALQPWSDAAKLWIKALRELGNQHPRYRVLWPAGKLDDAYAGKPLRVWIKIWIGTEEYRRLQAKMQSVNRPPQLLREVCIGGFSAVGLTYAHLLETWACSFPVAESAWLTNSVKATERSMDSNCVMVESDCEIDHISCIGHVVHWNSSLADWGQLISSTSRVGVVGTYSILMYSAPLEHGIAHVHVVEGKNRKNIAKYRIDPFERMEGRQRDLDAAMQNWIATHKAGLLSSWDRCMRGDHPYVIE